MEAIPQAFCRLDAKLREKRSRNEKRRAGACLIYAKRSEQQAGSEPQFTHTLANDDLVRGASELEHQKDHLKSTTDL